LQEIHLFTTQPFAWLQANKIEIAEKRTDLGRKLAKRKGVSKNLPFPLFWRGIKGEVK